MGKILFRILWRSANVALVVTVLALVYSAGWEYSVRRYLDGFTDAIIPANATRRATSRIHSGVDAQRPAALLGSHAYRLSDPRSGSDSELPSNCCSVCGTATNAFLNLARSADLQTRRLLLADSGSHRPSMWWRKCC